MIRCLVVDDSAVFRQVMREILSVDPEISVVGEARDGEEAVSQAVALRPDVITIDVQMPRKNGLQAIEEIMTRAATPIVVVCAGGGDESLGISFQALKLGALEVFEKPDRTDPGRFARETERIRRTVRAMAGVKVVTRVKPRRSPASPLEQSPPPLPSGAANAVSDRRIHGCIAIGASTGGPSALNRILSRLPADFPLPILVCQHITEGFTAGLTHWLDQQSPMRIKVAEEGEPLKAGTVYVAPDSQHLMVSRGRVRLDDGPAVRGAKPSATVLFTAVAREYGASAAGVLLTGMGSDGAVGLQLLRQRGGATIAQGPNSCVVYGMPREAFEMGAVERQLELDDISTAVLSLAGVVDGATPPLIKSKPRAASDRKKVLVVDDTETMLQIQRQALESLYEIVLARNGREGFEAAREHRPDLILLDYRMPEWTGVDALKALRACAETRSIPVLMVSSETDPEIVQSCWDGGCQDFLRKPFRAQALIAAVRRWMHA